MINSKNRKGFTLIELLVVISIIALLVSILMPSLSRARHQAEGVVCSFNIKSLSLAWIMYSEDNSGRIVGAERDNQRGYDWICPPVPISDSPSDPPIPLLDRELEGIRLGKLYPYLENVEVYHCPGDKRGTYGKDCYGSYGIIKRMNGNISLYETPLKKESEIKFPSEKIVFLEDMDKNTYIKSAWTFCPIPEHLYHWVEFLTVWHNGRSVFGFADGHAEIHMWEDERTLAMAVQHFANEYHEESVDWEYMEKAYNRKK